MWCTNGPLAYTTIDIHLDTTWYQNRKERNNVIPSYQGFYFSNTKALMEIEILSVLQKSFLSV